MPSPLIQNMIKTYHYPVLNMDNIDSFINSHDECVLFFTENPDRFPESNDVCMILPELVKEYDGRFHAAVIDPSAQRNLQTRYPFNEWPSLVFLRKGQFLGVISRVQDWNDYILKINHLLNSKATATPGIGVIIEQPHKTTGCQQ